MSTKDDDKKYLASAEADEDYSPSSTDHVDNNEVASTENRPSEEEHGEHHDHDLKISAATTLLGTATQQQADDSLPQSYNRRASLLSQTWQHDRHMHQTEAPPLNGGLPPYQQRHTIDALSSRQCRELVNLDWT